MRRLSLSLTVLLACSAPEEFTLAPVRASPPAASLAPVNPLRPFVPSFTPTGYHPLCEHMMMVATHGEGYRRGSAIYRGPSATNATTARDVTRSGMAEMDACVAKEILRQRFPSWERGASLLSAPLTFEQAKDEAP